MKAKIDRRTFQDQSIVFQSLYMKDASKDRHDLRRINTLLHLQSVPIFLLCLTPRHGLRMWDEAMLLVLYTYSAVGNARFGLPHHCVIRHPGMLW